MVPRRLWLNMMFVFASSILSRQTKTMCLITYNRLLFTFLFQLRPTGIQVCKLGIPSLEKLWLATMDFA